MLNERDQVSIVAVADKFSSHYKDKNGDIVQPSFDRKPHSQHHSSPSNQAPRMYPATMDNKINFFKFIENLNGTKEMTNHSLAFESAFKLLSDICYHRKTFNHGGDPIQMLYISRGLVSPLTEAKNVLESISLGQKALKYPVVINTCAVVLGICYCHKQTNLIHNWCIILDEKRVMYEKQFLKDVALQNYTKYNVDVADWLYKVPYNISGRMFVVNKQYPERLSTTSTDVFGYCFQQKSHLETRLVAQLPVYVESIEKGWVLRKQSFLQVL